MRAVGGSLGKWMVISKGSFVVAKAEYTTAASGRGTALWEGIEAAAR